MTELPTHEEHGEVVGTWLELGYRAETVVCFDRHLDLKPLSAAATDAITGADRASLPGLNRPLPLRDVPGAYGLDDFFATGAVLGTVSRLLWVVPATSPNPERWASRCVDAVALLPGDAGSLDRTAFVDGALRTRLCGLDVEVHTVGTLAETGVPADARIDIDLDWLADRGTDQEHTVDELTRTLAYLGCLDRVDSLTYSIRSGFLPPHLRSAAEEFARQSGRRLRPTERPDALPLPEKTFNALRGRHAPDSTVLGGLVEDELASLGSAGAVLGGLVAARFGDLDQAEQSWRDVNAEGMPGTWLAYDLGMRHYSRGDHDRALPWFERAMRDLIDPLEAHAGVLAALCLARLGRHHEAVSLCGVLAARYPLHRGVLVIGEGAAAAVGRAEQVEGFAEHRRRLDRLVSSGTRSRV